MKAMKKGDLALYYQSLNEKPRVGVLKFVKEFYKDPSIDDERWVAFDVEPELEVKKTNHLAEIKANSKLSEMVLMKNSRLSVQSVKKGELTK